VWFLVRRFILAFIVVYMQTAVIWQISLMTMTIITQVIILGRLQPFVLPSKTKYELFSEVVVMLVMYHLICFTPFVPDVDMRFRLGYSVSAIVIAHLAVSMAILLRITYLDLKFKYIHRNATKVHEK